MFKNKSHTTFLRFLSFIVISTLSYTSHVAAQAYNSTAGFGNQPKAKSRVIMAKLVPVEVNQLNAQERVIDQLARRHLGSQVRHNRTDLDMLQRMADRKIIKQSDSAKLQAMGVVMGKLLEKELGLVWMSYHDEVGYSRALCVVNTEHCLFPITMLSRRLEVGLTVNVKKIYADAVALIDPYIPDTNSYDGVKPDPTEKPQWIKDDEKKQPIKIRIQ